MAKVTYKSYNQNDSLLFPHCIGDFIPENDPVRVLDAIVEHLNISAIEATYKGGGASSFAPRMLLMRALKWRKGKFGWRGRPWPREREGPVGSKLSRSDDEDNNGRVRSERSERSPPQSLLSSRCNHIYSKETD